MLLIKLMLLCQTSKHKLVVLGKCCPPPPLFSDFLHYNTVTVVHLGLVCLDICITTCLIQSFIIQASSAGGSGDFDTAKKQNSLSVGCTITGLVSTFVGVAVFFGIIFGTLAN